MDNKVFHYADIFLSPSLSNSYPGSPRDKQILCEMINEWNLRTCISDLSKKWKKERPPQKERANLSILLFNVECLNTHIADVDLLLTQNKPHICILTGRRNCHKKTTDLWWIYWNSTKRNKCVRRGGNSPSKYIEVQSITK